MVSFSMSGVEHGRPICRLGLGNVPGRMRSAYRIPGLSSAWTMGVGNALPFICFRVVLPLSW